MRRFAERRSSISLVAEGQSLAGQREIAGFVIVHLEGNGRAVRGYLVTLDVAEVWRRRGLGGHLMEEAEKQAWVAGATAMDLHVYTENRAAIAFYERRRYVRTGLAKRFYGRAGMDAFLYRKMIDSE